ncbi:hypothetical protein V3F56_07570, partial [Moorellaceae bacterium AZ2]
RQLRQEVEFAGKPAGALSQALVWPAGEAFASESQAGLGSKLGIRQAKVLLDRLSLLGLIWNQYFWSFGEYYICLLGILGLNISLQERGG